MKYYDLHELVDGFRPYPDPKDVFSVDVELHAQYFLPLATIDLSIIGDDLEGVVHFIQPLEPYDDSTRNESAKYYTNYSRENYIGFRYDGNRCCFDGDFRYFTHRRLSLIDCPTEEEKQALQYYTNSYESFYSAYRRRRDHFQEAGMLYHPDATPPYSPDDRVQVALRIGGDAGWGNWTSSSAVPLGFSIRDDEHQFP